MVFQADGPAGKYLRFCTKYKFCIILYPFFTENTRFAPFVPEIAPITQHGFLQTCFLFFPVIPIVCQFAKFLLQYLLQSRIFLQVVFPSACRILSNVSYIVPLVSAGCFSVLITCRNSFDISYVISDNSAVCFFCSRSL